MGYLRRELKRVGPNDSWLFVALEPIFDHLFHISTKVYTSDRDICWIYSL